MVIQWQRCLIGWGVSTHSRYKWLRAIKPDNSEQHARDLLEAKSEILKLRARLKRTEEERDILKMAARYFAKEPEPDFMHGCIIRSVHVIKTTCFC